MSSFEFYFFLITVYTNVKTRYQSNRKTSDVLFNTYKDTDSVKVPKRYENIRMDLEEIGINAGNWVDSAQYRDDWRALVNAALNL